MKRSKKYLILVITIGICTLFSACERSVQIPTITAPSYSETATQVNIIHPTLMTTKSPEIAHETQIVTLTPSQTPISEPTGEFSITASPTLPNTPIGVTIVPDSLRIAYTTKDNDLVFWHQGITVTLTHSPTGIGTIKISGDGKYVAYINSDGLWVVQSDGKDNRCMVCQAQLDNMEPKDPGVMLESFDWFPNSHILLFNTRIKEDYGYDETDDLHSFNIDTLEYSLLLPPGKGGHFFVSPDASKIMVVSPEHIGLINSDGSGYTQLLVHKIPYPSEVAYYMKPVWYPDSIHIFVPFPPEDAFYVDDKTEPTQLLKVAVSNGEKTVLALLQPGCGIQSSVSPDMTQMHYKCVRHSGIYYFALPVSAMSGEEVVPLSKIECDDVDTTIWFPDSQNFVCGYIYNFQWISASQYLGIDDYQLYLADLEEQSVILATTVKRFDSIGELLPMNYQYCPEILESRLHIGDYAYVNLYPPFANIVRSGPSKGRDLVGQIEPGHVMSIFDGPICNDGMIWWKVEDMGTGITGWTVEGDSEGYWITPCTYGLDCDH